MSKPVAAEKYEFKAEVKQLLDILVHSLYTSREIFLRELISNSSDALDKLRFESTRGTEIEDNDLPLEIHVNFNDKKKLITVSDTGIGMTKDELINNIGTIAKSGSSEFIKKLQENKSEANNILGKFGVGFYSVFMVAEEVVIKTKSFIKNTKTVEWKSNGSGDYEISEIDEKIKRGTTIEIHLKEDTKDFADKFRLETVIKKHSNFVNFPIYLEKEKVNTVSAIWREPKSNIKKRALLPPLAAGDTIATLAFTEPNGRWDAAGVETTATPAGGRFRLDGVKSFVLDGHTADVIIVLARRPGSVGEEGMSFFTVPGDAPGLARRALKVMDPTRKQARLEFRAVEADLLGDEGGGAAPFARTMMQAAVCLANEMVGGAERLRQSALDYANLRVQFGRAIASFQSMKHKQADMLVDVELAKSAAYTAASAAAEDDADLPALASLAKACASEAYMQTAIHTIQIHGGIGFTWDNDTHLWFKRAKSSEVFLGDATYHRELMMRAWGV